MRLCVLALCIAAVTACVLFTASFGRADQSLDADDCPLALQMREYEIAAFRRMQSPENSGHHTMGCVAWDAGYWSYDACPGRWVRQFRRREGVIVEEHFLGLQRHWQMLDDVGTQRLRYDTGEHTVPERLVAMGVANNLAMPRYTCPKQKKKDLSDQVVFAKYIAGSVCDGITSRTTTIRLVCDESMQVPRVALTEPFICNYELVLRSRAVCDAFYGRIRPYIELSDADMKFQL